MASPDDPNLEDIERSIQRTMQQSPPPGVAITNDIKRQADLIATLAIYWPALVRAADRRETQQAALDALYRYGRAVITGAMGIGARLDNLLVHAQPHLHSEYLAFHRRVHQWLDQSVLFVQRASGLTTMDGVGNFFEEHRQLANEAHRLITVNQSVTNTAARASAAELQAIRDMRPQAAELLKPTGEEKHMLHWLGLAGRDWLDVGDAASSLGKQAAIEKLCALGLLSAKGNGAREISRHPRSV